MAARAVVVGKDLDEVVDAAKNDLTGHDVGHGTVIEHDVHDAVVLDVVVVGTQQLPVLVPRQAGELVGTGADGLWPDGGALACQPLDPFQVEDAAQRMDALADQRTAAGVAPGAVDRAGGAIVAFLAGQAQHLRSRLGDDLTLLLHAGGVDEVLAVAEEDIVPTHRVADAQQALDHLGEHGLLGRPVTAPARVGSRRTETAGQRLLAEDALASSGRGQNPGLVDIRRGADVEQIDVLQQRLNRREDRDAVRRAERLATLATQAGDSRNLDPDAVDAAQTVDVIAPGKARADQSDPQRLHGAPQYLPFWVSKCVGLPRFSPPAMSHCAVYSTMRLRGTDGLPKRPLARLALLR